MEFRLIQSIIEGLPISRKEILLKLLNECVSNEDYIRLIINIEIDLLIKSIELKYLDEKLKSKELPIDLTPDNFVKFLIETCGRDFCLSHYESITNEDYISYITTEEFISHLCPAIFTLDKVSIERNPERWVKILNKHGLSNFRGPFKHKYGDPRIPWVTKFSYVSNKFEEIKDSTISFGDFINDALGLGYSSTDSGVTSFTAIRYSNKVAYKIYKPTFIDGSLYGFPGRFINDKPYLDNHGRTVSTNKGSYSMPEAVHKPIDKLTDDFIFEYIGPAHAVIDDSNLTKIALERFNLTKSEYE